MSVDIVEVREGPTRELPFKILAEGPFNPTNIRVIPTNQTIKRTPELDEYIERIWREVSKGDPNFSNGKKALLAGFSTDGTNLVIETGITDFKELVATQRSEVVAGFGMESVAVTLGACGILETADDKLVLAQRRTSHRTKRGGLHSVGGRVDLSDLGDHPDITRTMARETEEETGLRAGEYQILEVLGLMQSIETYAADLLFRVGVSLTEKQLRGRSADQEITLLCFPSTPEDLRNALLTNFKTASSPSIALAYLYGKQKFGLDWANYVAQRFERRRAIYKTFDPTLNERARMRLENKLKRQTT